MKSEWTRAPVVNATVGIHTNLLAFLVTNAGHIFYLIYLGLFGTPKRSGKLKDISKFDALFFAIHPQQASVMDPQLRILLEVTYEALLDAGGRFSNYSCLYCKMHRAHFLILKRHLQFSLHITVQYSAGL